MATTKGDAECNAASSASNGRPDGGGAGSREPAAVICGDVEPAGTHRAASAGGAETYTGRRGPRDVLVTLGTTITWRSDRSVQR